MLLSNEPSRSKTLPPIPISEDKFVETIDNSELSWVVGRNGLGKSELRTFFDRLWRNEILRWIDKNRGEFNAQPYLSSFCESLQYPFKGEGGFAIQAFVGEQNKPFAFTGGYLFENDDRELEMFLASDKGWKARPFGDFHDIAFGEFNSKFGKNINKMNNSQRCLFFHTWNVETNSIEYLVLPVETIHRENGLSLGESHQTEYIKGLSNDQIVEFEKKYSMASYATTKIIVTDKNREHEIAAIIAQNQLLPKILERAKIRVDYDMEPDEALREAMRERILSRSGVSDAFSRYYRSNADDLNQS